MSYRRNDFSVTAIAARIISALLDRWPLVLIVLFFISPVGPHLRWEYTYRGVGDYRSYVSCTYLGSRGFVTPSYMDDCPVFAWLDSRGSRP